MMNLNALSIRAAAELERRKRAKLIQPPLTFRAFVDKVTQQRFQWYRHCVVLSDVLQRVADDDPDYTRVLVFEPPRHGKSEEVSRLFPAYYLYRHPERFVGINSYAADLAYTLSRAARDNFTKADGEIRDDAGAVKHWETKQGGGLWAAGVGGPITGKGFHLGIIDDPLKNAEEAQSVTIREKQKEWYDSTFYTRAEPGAAIIVVQTRWNEDDLSGYLLSKENDEDGLERWHIVNFQAIRDSEDAPVFPPTCMVEPDWRADGEPLCPERYPLKRLQTIAARIGAYFWGSLFQQRPRPKEGNYFKREWFDLVPAIPALGTRVRYWDKAGASEGKGDWTVGVLMMRDSQGLFYVEDVQRFQKQAADRNALILQTAQFDQRKYGSVSIYVEQPPGLAKEATDSVVRLLAGFVVHADAVHKDKETRAEPFAAQAQAHNVKVLSAPWTEAWLNELCDFPTGKHDDQVDASSGAFNKLADSYRGFVHVYDQRVVPERKRGFGQ